MLSIMAIYEHFLLLIDRFNIFKSQKRIKKYVDYRYSLDHFKIFYKICTFRIVHLCVRCHNFMNIITITLGVENN